MPPLRDERHQKTSEEWESTVLSTLLGSSRAGEPAGTGKDRSVEIVATISPSDLTVIIRRKIESVIWRLGSIPVKKDEDFDIDTLDWTHTALVQRDELSLEIEAIQSRSSTQEATIAELTTELDGLIKAKQEHEDTLMARFCQLMNAKKLKIRDQQRLLAGAKIDPNLAAQVQRTRANDSQRLPGRSTRGKRKATRTTPNDEDDEAFAVPPIRKELNQAGNDDSEETDKQQTSGGSETADETIDDEGQEKEVSAPHVGTPIFDNRDASRDADPDVDNAPAPRTLPFSASASTTGQRRQEIGFQEEPDSSTLLQQTGGDDEETTEDDEL